MHPDTLAYHATRVTADRLICEALAHAIEEHLPDAENRVWHGHPVWFLDGNPIVGYANMKDHARRKGRLARLA